MCSEHIQGDERGAYVALARFSMTQHGMAYGARALGSRRANSTREGNVSPGRTGEPCTGGSGPGGRMIKAVRYACCGWPKQNWSSPEWFSVKTTGELIDIESVRHGTHGVNCPQRGPKFKADDFEATHLPDSERIGNKSMVGKREMSEDVYGMVLQRLRDRVRAGLSEPQCPAVERHTRR